MSWKKLVLIGMLAIALALGASGGARAQNLVPDPYFSDFVTPGPGANTFLNFPGGASVEPGFQAPGATLTYWTNNDLFATVYSPGAADLTGSQYGTGGVPIYLWGPNNPMQGSLVSPYNSMNGLPATDPNHPGTNFLAADSDPYYDGQHQGYTYSLQTTINDLTPGGHYMLSFDYAAAQFRQVSAENFNGATFGDWQVSLGAQTLVTTTTLNIGSHGFSTWFTECVAFTYTGNTDCNFLQFLAVGGPSGLPPVMLLDGVSVSSVPEPTSLLLMVVGLLGLGAVSLRRRAKSPAV